MIPPQQPPQGMVQQATAPQGAAPQGAAPQPQAAPGPEATAPQGMIPPPAEAQGTEAETETEMTPEENKAMESGMQMVSEILYNDDTAHETIMDGLTKGKPEESIGEVTMFILDQVEQQFNGNFPESAVIPMADEISDMLLELAETKGIMEIDEGFYQRSKGMMMQGLVEAYGIEEADMESMMQGVTAEDVQTMQKTFGGGQE